MDLMTYVVAETSGLPKSRVIGSGTVLDTARLRYIMSSYFKVSSKNIHAYIIILQLLFNFFCSSLSNSRFISSLTPLPFTTAGTPI